MTSPDDRAPQLEILHDGGCSLCAKEIRLLRKLDRKGRILLTDIQAPDFDATALGTDHDTLMRRIHGRLPDGTWIEGVEVFRRAYAAIGLGWLVPLTRLPGIRALLDAGYVRFARWRYERRLREGCAIPPRESAKAPRPAATAPAPDGERPAAEG